MRCLFEICIRHSSLAQVLSESEPEHILRFHGACLWNGNLTLITELMQVRQSS